MENNINFDAELSTLGSCNKEYLNKYLEHILLCPTQPKYLGGEKIYGEKHHILPRYFKKTK